MTFGYEAENAVGIAEADMLQLLVLNPLYKDGIRAQVQLQITQFNDEKYLKYQRQEVLGWQQNERKHRNTRFSQHHQQKYMAVIMEELAWPIIEFNSTIGFRVGLVVYTSPSIFKVQTGSCRTADSTYPRQTLVMTIK